MNQVQKPGNYLGMPMIIGRNKHETFSFLVERVQQKLHGRQNRVISKGGNFFLLKTAAQVIPNFWVSMFLVPVKICDRIEKLKNAYWWINGGDNAGIKWLSWDRIYETKEASGMGFKKLRSFNIPMLAKQAWRLVNNANPLLTQIMCARCYPNTYFLNATIGSNPSYVWRSLLES